MNVNSFFCSLAILFNSITEFLDYFIIISNTPVVAGILYCRERHEELRQFRMESIHCNLVFMVCSMLNESFHINKKMISKVGEFGGNDAFNGNSKAEIHHLGSVNVYYRLNTKGHKHDRALNR